MKPMDMEKRRKRIRHISNLRSKRELCLTPGFQTHEALWMVTKLLPTDFKPYGNRKRLDGEIHGDCSSNCRVVPYSGWRARRGLGRPCKSQEPPSGPADF